MPRPGAGGRVAVDVLAAAALAGGTWWWTARGPALPARPVAAAPGPAPAAAPGDGGMARPRAPDDAAARMPARWRRLVREELDRRIDAAGLAGTLGEAEREELVALLATVRRASRAGRRRSRDPRWQAKQSRTLVAADERFRARLGIGIAEFVAAAGDADRVTDLAAGPR